MNKLELIGLLREMVKDELRDLLQSKNGRAIIREVISREVRAEVNNLLTEMEQGSEEKEIIEEESKDIKLSRMVERGELPPKKKEESISPVSFTKNQKLNSLLNDTLRSVVSGEAQFPSQMGSDGQAALLREQYNTSVSKVGENPTEESSGRTVASMLPNVDVNGHPLRINPNGVPDYLKNALTRNYRTVMKKVDEKRG